jgi:hypothetical protein
MDIDVIDTFFVSVQLVNIVLSIILIITGVFLFPYIRNIMHHVDGYIHTMIVLHVLVSFFILTGYNLAGLDSSTNIIDQFASHLAILTLGIINIFFQLGVYKVFFFIKAIHGNENKEINIDETEIKFVFDNIAKCSKSDNTNYFNSK